MSAFNDPRLLRRPLEPQSDPGKRPECRRCGYDLTGLPAGAVCPECGAERTRARKGEIQKQRAGLVAARPGEIRRFGIGFLFLALPAIASPMVLVIGWTPTAFAAWTGGGLALVWMAGVTLLNVRRFTCGENPPDEKPLERILRYGAMGTQWAWPAAVGVLALGLPQAAAWTLAGIGAVGLLPTLWSAGNALEWGGDEEGGSITRRALLYVGFAWGLLAFGALIPFISFLFGAAVLLGLLFLYFKTAVALLSGVAMAMWAIEHQRHEAGKLDRLRERRERVEAAQAARIRAEERARFASRNDRPVSVDDFQS